MRFIYRKVWASIAGRLVTLTFIMSVLIVVSATLFLGGSYRKETEALLNGELEATIQTLTNALNSDPDGTIVLDQNLLPNDPRFQRVLSGWYYGYLDLDRDLNVQEPVLSRSIWDGGLPVDMTHIEEAYTNLGQVFYHNDLDPDDKPIRVALRAVLLPDRETPVALFAAINSEAALSAETALRHRLVAVVGLMLSGMLVAIGFLIHHGLAPLRRIRENLDAIRDGRETRLIGEYSTEIEPLVEDMNRVLDHNQEVVDRARTHVGNLAHALKNPIAVLMNETGGDEAYSAMVKQHAKAMWQNVDHYLKRAQAAARAEVLGARTEVEPTVEDIAILLERIHRDKNLAVEIDIDEDAVFKGERQDLDDLVGNLLENAAKWCKRRMRVTIRVKNDQLIVFVDDDGPGLKPAEREIAVQRGQRLDETEPGTGLGLSIVKELAEMYGGSFALDNSPFGGLRAHLILPAAT
ncbi:histidine kinase [Hirschia baltica ATCC 49814]|uniref:histidine kinase n=1 Tax=Hirschia baltica (strain ATCC 49814 / DSM 5838 / IFAM 1418) TaxID=582402 RepID=C6XIL8_HIRBI|nr:histidine kinase [Hirschia baltica ATCC 49814]